MPAPSEPEQYSIDEMMDRLKNRLSEDSDRDGELVTRPDGSQAIKVRKRKRRSHQPHKEKEKQQRRARMLQVSGALLLLLIAGLAAGTAIVYANSAPFRQKLLAKIATTSGATAELEQFRVTPSRANAGRLILSWPAGNVLKDLTVRGVSASIAPQSFLGKVMSGEEVTGVEGTLRLASPEPGELRLVATRDDQPSTIRFRRYAIPRLNVVVGNPTQPALVLRESEISFYPDNPKGRPQLLVNRGEILAPGWPKIKMDRAHIEFREGEIDIVGMRLLHQEDSRGVLEVSGTVAPYVADRPSQLSLRLDAFLMSGLLGPDLGSLVSGRLDSVSTLHSNLLTFTPTLDEPARIAVSFRNSLGSPIELQGFKFLTSLARLLEDNWFERPVFELDATGTIRSDNGIVTLENLDFQHKGRMAIRGEITANRQRQLTGKLQLGISEAMIKATENPQLHAMFGPAEDDYRWISLNISGTTNAPADDFLQIFESTKTTASPPPAQAVPTFEELTAPE